MYCTLGVVRQVMAVLFLTYYSFRDLTILIVITTIGTTDFQDIA